MEGIEQKVENEAIFNAIEESNKFSTYPITSNYGERTDPFTNKISFHNGIDYALPENTDVIANIAGTVTSSTYDDSRGNYVVVTDGTGKLHYYQHLNKNNVNVGDIVSVGDSLGLSGSTGCSTGPHLHYEVRENGVSINPLSSGSELNLGVDVEEIQNNAWSWTDGIMDKVKNVTYHLFKFIAIILIIALFVICITKALDISII